MKAYFTICSNNYLAYASVLGSSLRIAEPGASFYLFLCDEKAPNIDYTTIADQVIPLAAIEPRLHELAGKYNIIELNTCVKPHVFQYLLTEKNFDQVIYLDPDIYVYNNLSPSLQVAFENASILLTPHIYTAIPLDGKQPQESVFLNFGIYNLGFIAVKKNEEVNRFLAWWKERTYQQGFIDVYNGIFVDQLPINLVPILFKGVHILQDHGLNMAPWNLHERILSQQGKQYLVNEQTTLKFYHFSSFKPGRIELPTARYNRYNLSDRPDLLALYQAYGEALTQAGYGQYHLLPCSYDKPKKKKWFSK
ncbi:hypothetical protein [Paraflavitalea sp. CAU 1676]|uniref:hypothetical protein n=1 Tax=Paraflavitalea sp. CAU 1676 TaxID=3032598 RepID=UPI0023DBE303|nr:hypothetical protein [Paraflavitalea sp. CAU 1676]MDF2190580.1 hypothetical protein [Paraflavitalea sp. CAU 1676]